MRFPLIILPIGVVAFIAAVLGLSFWTSNSGSIAVAQAPKAIENTPIGSSEFLKVKSIEIISKEVPRDNLDLRVDKIGDMGIRFVVVNEVDADADIVADVWEVKIGGLGFDTTEETTNVGTNIQAAGSKVVADLDLENWISYFQHYPGIYEVSVNGFNEDHALVKAEDLDEKGIEYETNELRAYHLSARIIIGFDEEAIREKGNVLKADNVLVATENPNSFELDTEDVKTVMVSVINTNDFPVSSLVHYHSVNTWSVEETKVVGYEGISDYEENTCEVLEPGESVEVTSYSLDGTKAPLGGERGLSNKIDGKTVAVPGLYVVGVEGATVQCVQGDKEIPGIQFSSMIAFEVK
jgi:hypothetical protein